MQVHYIWPNGKGQLLVSTEEEPPTYQRLLSLLQAVPGSKASRSWVERVLTPDWLPGSSVPVDPELQSSPSSQPYDAKGTSSLTRPKVCDVWMRDKIGGAIDTYGSLIEHVKIPDVQAP